MRPFKDAPTARNNQAFCNPYMCIAAASDKSASMQHCQGRQGLSELAAQYLLASLTLTDLRRSHW